MSELTPEERRRIYEEERVRLEAQADLKTKPSSGKSCCWGGCAVLIVLWLLLGMFGSSCSNQSSPISDYSAPSTTTAAQVDALQKEMEVAEARDKAKIVVTKHDWTSGDYGYDYVRGSIKNNSDHTVCYWKVTTDFYNKKGEVIDSAFTNSGENLRPGASKRFEIMHSHIPGAEKARTFVDEVQFGGD